MPRYNVDTFTAFVMKMERKWSQKSSGIDSGNGLRHVIPANAGFFCWIFFGSADKEQRMEHREHGACYFLGLGMLTWVWGIKSKTTYIVTFFLLDLMQGISIRYKKKTWLGFYEWNFIMNFIALEAQHIIWCKRFPLQDVLFFSPHRQFRDLRFTYRTLLGISFRFPFLFSHSVCCVTSNCIRT